MLKAKHFKTIRKKAKFYFVLETQHHLLGEFTKGNCSYLENIPLTDFTKVFARSYHEAIKRYNKKNNKSTHIFYYKEKENWAQYKIIPAANPFMRFATYWR